MKDLVGGFDCNGLKIGLVVSRFNKMITDRLLDGALDYLRRNGISEDEITVVRVPGSFEIPFTVQRLAQTGNLDAIICLGALIRGETPHFEYIAHQVTEGIAQLGLKFDLPVTYGIITANTLEQAVNRAGAKHGNKGVEAAQSAVEMVNLVKKLAT